MTKEELKKEAIKFAVGYPTSYGKGYKHKDLRIAYLAGAEPREKHIAELKEQIEKMKCCGNCKYFKFQDDVRYYTCIKDGNCNGKNYRSCEFNLEKWELKEIKENAIKVFKEERSKGFPFEWID